MSNIKKIRQEIMRLRCESGPEHFDFYELLDHFKEFINSLPEEKPSEELEEEVKNYFEGYWPGTDTPEQCNTDLHFTPPAIMRFARHFAEWGAKHLK